MDSSDNRQSGMCCAPSSPSAGKPSRWAKAMIRLTILLLPVVLLLPVRQGGGLSVAPNGPTVLVIDMTDHSFANFNGLNVNSSGSIITALQANGYAVDSLIEFPSVIDPAACCAVFLCLGIYPYNHVLTEDQIQVLKSYLESEGRLYMEGGDAWVYDPKIYKRAGLNSYFGLENPGPWQYLDYLGGADHLTGIPGTFMEGFDITYQGFSNFADFFLQSNIAPDTQAIWNNVDNGNRYSLLGVARSAVDEAGWEFKTIGISFEFGGIPADQQAAVMSDYMGYFAPPPAALQARPAFLPAGPLSPVDLPDLRIPQARRSPRHMPDESLDDRLNHHAYPKLFNQIQGGRDESGDVLLREAARWDLLDLDAESIETIPGYLGADGILRGINPDLVLTLYFSAADIIPDHRGKLNSGFILGMKDLWYIRDIFGQKARLFELMPGLWTNAVNLSTDANAFMPYFLNKHLISTRLADGIYYDWIQEWMSWLNDHNDPIDIDNDGVADSDQKIDNLWVQGTLDLLWNTINTFPSSELKTGNGVGPGASPFAPVLQGRMVEGLQAQFGGEDNIGWHYIMRGILLHNQDFMAPGLMKVMCQGTQDDFPLMRYGLATTLLLDGYYCYTNPPPNSYEQTWWYDEYSVNLLTGQAADGPEFKGWLGQPQTDAYDVTPGSSLLQSTLLLKDLLLGNDPTSSQRVWRRDFAHGIILVNPTGSAQTINLGGSFKKIHGPIDPSYNDGSSLTVLDLGPESGALLLKTLSTPPLSLTVDSSPGAGVPIDISLSDLYGHGGWNTPFSRYYSPGAEVTLSAPQSHSGLDFIKWTLGQEEFSRAEIQINIQENRTATAVYEAQACGALQLPQGKSAAQGAKIHIPISFSGNSAEITDFGFDFVFNPDEMSLSQGERCSLIQDWAIVDITPFAPGRIRVTGSAGSGTPIPVSSSGCLVTLKFVMGCLPYSEETPMLIQAEAFSGDLQCFQPDPCTSGVLFIPCPALGDVSGNGTITPGDAQMAFEIFLGIRPPDFCQLTAADADCSCPCGCREHSPSNACITPGDAQRIFEHYLEKIILPSCCEEYQCPEIRVRTEKGPIPPERRKAFLPDAAGSPGETIKIPVLAAWPGGLRSFRLEVAFPADMLVFLGIQRSPLTKGFEMLRAEEMSSGGILLKGAGSRGIQSDEEQGPLALLVFQVKAGAPEKGTLMLSQFIDGAYFMSRSSESSFIRVPVPGDGLKKLWIGPGRREGEVSVIPVFADDGWAVKAFGLTLSFPPEKLTFLGLRRTEQTASFQILEGREIQPGLIKLGGFGLSRRLELGQRPLFEILFRADSEAVLDIRIEETWDDLAGHRHFP